ncbi:hypothetical protein M9H77_30523 [Catharanthus roseus]|uniref:Uncharacterized protein n=1 Tax=Catharanthus roseus TaxID=4058 RepID=A0ACB9ZXV6_CATRO|nr:hypothetical protein M9H77_30523 [Catharanthus roseus]
MERLEDFLPVTVGSNLTVPWSVGITKSSIEVLQQVGDLGMVMDSICNEIRKSYEITSKSNMEDELHHVQQALEGLEQQLSCLAKGVRDLKGEKEAILEQSSRRNLDGNSTHNN